MAVRARPRATDPEGSTRETSVGEAESLGIRPGWRPLEEGRSPVAGGSGSAGRSISKEPVQSVFAVIFCFASPQY